ncbi:MAG TPA: mycofactocin radical SAM maturase, partial [Actinomycetota bacterium]|nr:mycofactocin radical SAM maturase [Actinomycetota bacterium]
RGYGEAALAAPRTIPGASQDHSRTTQARNQPVLLQLRTRRPAGPDRPAAGLAPPVSACAQSPLAGFVPEGSAR